MTTVEERREVARRLRELDYSDLQESLICAYLDALGIKGYEDWIGIAHRLADLIEPSEPKVRCVAEVKVDGERLEQLAYDAAVELTGIDCDALSALADEMEEFGNLPAKHPGVRVLHNEDFSRELGYARRIREACGEVPDAGAQG
mgnify:CR=1 FL=1|jgi:hypothetical protein|nr:MAG TPA: hypothetical protein [Caudoviricetes sp.]